MKSECDQFAWKENTCPNGVYCPELTTIACKSFYDKRIHPRCHNVYASPEYLISIRRYSRVFACIIEMMGACHIYYIVYRDRVLNRQYDLVGYTLLRRTDWTVINLRNV